MQNYRQIESAAIFVFEEQEATITGLQRKFVTGYNKAERLMLKLEEIGVVSVGEAFLPRKVIISSADELQKILNKLVKEAKAKFEAGNYFTNNHFPYKYSYIGNSKHGELIEHPLSPDDTVLANFGQINTIDNNGFHIQENRTGSNIYISFLDLIFSD